jgi:hypothetical protein
MDIGQGQLSYAIWLQLPADIRHKLVILFNIPRSGSTVVDYRASGPVVTSDGYTAPDLQTITLVKMQGLLQSDSDNFYKLFEEVATNIDALLGGTFGAVATSSTVLPPPETRVEDKGVQFYDDKIGEEMAEVAKLIKPPFCDSCDSKGGRHKKVCPKYA